MICYREITVASPIPKLWMTKLALGSRFYHNYSTFRFQHLESSGPWAVAPAQRQYSPQIMYPRNSPSNQAEKVEESRNVTGVHRSYHLLLGRNHLCMPYFKPLHISLRQMSCPKERLKPERQRERNGTKATPAASPVISLLPGKKARASGASERAHLSGCRSMT